MSGKWAMFCEASSIRGMQKITKAKTPFSKSLWTIFVIVMTLVLVITSGFLVNDFLNYNTAWHTSTEFDNKPQFPSFTLCSHNPFGQAAKAAWAHKTVMTPLEFQALLKRVSSEGVRHEIGAPLVYMFAYDNVDTYYQHLAYNDTVAISHNDSSLFFCVGAFGGVQVIAENCVFESNEISVKLFSHSEFFNCFTLDTGGNEDFESITVVMTLVPTHDIGLLNHSFLYDVLNKGEGVKVTIHEKGVLPDIAQSGFNVEPGRMNEVNYATTSWQKLRTPKQECRDDQTPIPHLTEDYISDYHQCANVQLQRHLISECGCINSLWPVVQVPTRSVPYCIDLNDQTDLHKLNQRLKCTQLVLENEKQLKANLSAAVCFPRCRYFTYESTLSITKWIPSPSKLEALADQYKAHSLLGNNTDQFLKILGKNISEYNSLTYNSRLSEQNSYTYIKIKRKNWDVIKKVEKLTLDVNVLLSRIGGLCSLCIGLTAAFAVELVEFVYFSFQRSPTAKEQQGGPAGGGDQGDQLAMEQAALLLPDGSSHAVTGGDPWEKRLCADFGAEAAQNHQSAAHARKKLSA